MNFENVETQLANVRAGVTTLRPAWLADNNQWREQLSAIPEDEAAWIAEHWDMAGGAKPAPDTSWITTETIGTDFRSVAVIGVPVVAFCILLGLFLSWMVLR